MAVRQPRYSMEEFARRGDEIYDKSIRPQVEAGNKGKFVAIDIESGAWEMDEDDMKASKRLLESHPDAQTWVIRVGYPYVDRIGGFLELAK
jgi:hypothetical protein